MAIIETERLTMRDLAPEDVEELAPIFADAEMMRFYPAPFSRERTAGWIDWSRRLYSQRGHGLWALVRRADGLFLGDCGLVPQLIEGAELLEIGYHVRRDQWGHGYASEAARACRDYAFATLAAPEICSVIDPLNGASRRVAERVHQDMRLFHWEKTGKTMCLYTSRRP
ncbi:MAG: GNAT family N-acetyltransferase [Chloroflexales bacterium]|nr:GNAT family N-acetyltransferase [Chloroflexales bacterium]